LHPGISTELFNRYYGSMIFIKILLPQKLTLMPVGAGCGLAKLSLEFSAVGDFEAKQQP